MGRPIDDKTESKSPHDTEGLGTHTPSSPSASRASPPPPPTTTIPSTSGLRHRQCRHHQWLHRRADLVLGTFLLWFGCQQVTVPLELPKHVTVTIDMEEDDDVESEASSDSLELDQREEKWIQHYSNSHRILLVGEGDFSFSLSLANAFGSATNMVATSLDSQETLARNYTNGIKNVRELEELGCLVLLGIDATKMSDHFFLRTQRFDRIIYNFPHVGFQYSESNNFQIESNKRLLKGFFKNAKVLLQDNGEIHVTHKIGEIYDKWNVVKKAEKNGLIHKGRAPFSKADYPGYCNKRAHGRSPDAEFYIGACSTFIFGVKEACLRIRNTT